MKRTIPSAYPALREKDAYNRKILRAELVRRIALAQNYLWSQQRRIYANHAYEGNGQRLQFGHDPSKAPFGFKDPTNGSDFFPLTQGKLLASFLCPPNWGPSQRLLIQGHYFHTVGATFKIRIVAGLYTLGGEFMGITADSGDLSNNLNWQINISTPGDKTVQVGVWIVGVVGSSETTQVTNISARYQQANDEELHGGPATQYYISMADTQLPAGESVASAILRHLVRNTNALYGAKPPEICQSYLGLTYHNTTTYTEVGRYHILASMSLSEYKVRLIVKCTHGGANNRVRVNVSGETPQESADLAVGYNTVDFTFPRTGVSKGSGPSSIVVTIDAKSSAAGANWGTDVVGVYMYESAYNLFLPSGVTVPTDYKPLNEELLVADQAIRIGTTGVAKELRAGIINLIQNDLWLAKNRTRWLIGDWRHRVYKRVDYFSGAGTWIGPDWDWTEGNINNDRATLSPRNITIRGQGNLDQTDGWTGFPYGLSTGGAGGVYTNWPTAANNSYTTHGRRLGRFEIINPTGVSAHPTQTGSKLRIWLRGRRRRTTAVTRPFDGKGPAAEGHHYTDRGYFNTIYSGSDHRVAIAGAPVAGFSNPLGDWDPRWVSPFVKVHPATTGGTLQIAGRLPPPDAAAGSPHVREEGELFEIELQGAFILDEPLPQSTLDALP